MERLSRLAIAEEVHRAGAHSPAPFDLVVCFRLQSAVFLERAEAEIGPLAIRRVADLDDLESVLLQRCSVVFGPTDSLDPTPYAHEADLARGAEDRCLATHDLVMVASPADEWRLRQRGDDVRLAVVPNCVAWPETPLERTMPMDTVLTFVGNYGYEPNIDAVRWFVRQVMPRLVRCTAVRFRVDVVGYNISRLPASLRDHSHLRLVGEVETLRQTYEESDIVIAPIRVGSGTRIKILEAMSYGLPVVSTSAGIEGIRAVSGEHVLVADGAASFARACANLMSDRSLRRAIGARARDLVQAHYTVDAVRPVLSAMIFDEPAPVAR